MQAGGLRAAVGCAIIYNMKKYAKISTITALLLAVTLLSACGLLHKAEPTDPHAGMVEVYNGAGNAWVRPWRGVALSTLTREDFAMGDGGVVTYTGTQYRVQQGVDVSYFQGEIDWNAVAAAGVEFAFIRAGYRGYVDGGIFPDERLEANALGARAAGLEIGLYFFSQAVSPEEAEEEAQWLLDVADDYDVTLPLCFDWEAQVDTGEDTPRTDGMLGREMTACAAAFCKTIRDGGYTPCVYANRWQGYYDYDLSQLADADLWISAPGTWDDFYYAHTIWQYSYEGHVEGISAAVDRNLRFLPITE